MPKGKNVMKIVWRLVLGACVFPFVASANLLSNASFEVPAATTDFGSSGWTAYGTSVLACDLLVGAYAGFVIGYAVYATGLLFTFGMTVLPVLCAREVAGSLRAGARLALLFGSTAPVAGLLCAHRFDLPPGQATVALLGALALLLRLLSAWRCHRRA